MPGGRPMSRAATTGFTELGSTDPRQLAHHLAQHPHSPYLMASQHLDVANLGSSNFNSIQQHSTLVNPLFETTNATNSVQVNKLSTQSHGNKAVEIRLEKSQLVQPTMTHQASIGYIIDGRLSQTQQNFDANQDPINSQMNHHYNDVLDHWERDSIMSKNPSIQSETITITLENRARRRTLPSIMTEPPLLSLSSKSQTAKQVESKSRTTTNQHIHPILDDQTVHSAENLQSRAAETYIIENGIRKRVQAENQQYHQHSLRCNETNYYDGSMIEGSRPKWTM